MTAKVPHFNGAFLPNVDDSAYFESDLVELDVVRPQAHRNLSSSNEHHEDSTLRRELDRTPSPTPSEAEELDALGPINWRKYCDWRFWVRKEWTRKC